MASDINKWLSFNPCFLNVSTLISHKPDIVVDDIKQTTGLDTVSLHVSDVSNNNAPSDVTITDKGIQAGSKDVNAD